jgi:hypothetical protein
MLSDPSFRDLRDSAGAGGPDRDRDRDRADDYCADVLRGDSSDRRDGDENRTDDGDRDGDRDDKRDPDRPHTPVA